MPVHRFANYPDTRAYSNAFIVVHAGVNWGTPMVDGLMGGGAGETIEFGKAAFQTVDWTRDDISPTTVVANERSSDYTSLRVEP